LSGIKLNYERTESNIIELSEFVWTLRSSI